MSTKFRRKLRISQAHLKLEGQKLFSIDDSGGVLSNFGGFPILASLAHKSGLLRSALAKIEDHRNSSRVKHPMALLLLERILLNSAGFPDATDCSFWSNDPALKSSLGCAMSGPPLPSQSTQTRWENGISSSSIEGLEALPLEFYFSQQEHAPRSLTIYLDGSAIRTFGTQQNSMYRGGKKYSQTQYFPLIATTDGGELLLAKLREGSASDASTLAIIKDLLKKVKGQWKDISLTVVMDTGFNSPALLDFLDEENISYAIGYPCTSSVRSKIKDLMRAAESEFRKTYGAPQFMGKKAKKEWQSEHERIRSLPQDQRVTAEKQMLSRHVRWIHQSDHNGTKWCEDRPLIHRVDFTDKGLDIRCVVTNIKDGLAEEVYDDFYCRRSRIEMFIKEQKSHCKVPLSCQEFTANQFRFSGIQALTYMLLHMLRNELPESNKPISLSRIRQQILLVPVLIKETERRLHWSLSSVHPHSKTLVHLARKLNSRTA